VDPGEGAGDMAGGDNYERLKGYCLRAVDRHYEEVAERIVHMEQLRSGMLPSEMLLVLSVGLEQGVRCFFESGRKLGYSTRLLATRREWNVTSFERSPILEADRELLREFPEVRLVHGEASDVVPPRVVECARRRALLIDGPKGEKAFALADEVVDRVAFYAIHDLHKRAAGHKEQTAQRTIAEGRLCFLSDDPEWVELYSWMDSKAWVGQYCSWREMTHYAYIVGIFPGGRWQW